MKIADPEKLEKFVEKILIKIGVNEEDSKLVANHLIFANLYGVDSHGVVRLPYYVRAIRDGFLNPAPKPKVVGESRNMLLLDGDRGLGQPIAMKITQEVIKKANDDFIGFGGAINLGHVGMLTYYIHKVVENKMVGLAITNAPSVMAPLGAKESFLGTNPVAIGLPYKEGKHIIFDTAMSVASRGKILVAMKKGTEIPPNWALDVDGKPTTDPRKAIEGTLLPDGVKGYAIALLIDLFCGAVLGGRFGYELPANFSSQGGFAILAISPEFFRDYDHYLRDLEDYIKKLKNLPTAEGFKEITIPGEPEQRRLKERKRGVPIDSQTLQNLIELSGSLGVGLDFIIAQK
jgi:LDH2 family malate/lactate/ureidoglycolate dehydrogenase